MTVLFIMLALAYSDLNVSFPWWAWVLSGIALVFSFLIEFESWAAHH